MHPLLVIVCGNSVPLQYCRNCARKRFVFVGVANEDAQAMIAEQIGGVVLNSVVVGHVRYSPAFPPRQYLDGIYTFVQAKPVFRPYLNLREENLARLIPPASSVKGAE
jgi:hypothetical protein